MSAFLSCQLSAEVAIEQGSSVAEEVCTVPPEWHLVGLPPGQASDTELEAVGVPGNLVSMVQGNERKSRFCLVRETPMREVPNGESQETGRGTCADTEILIDELVYARAGTVVLSVVRTASGQPRLVRLEPQ